MHLSANIGDATPKALQEELHARIRALFEAPDLQTARILLAQVIADYEQRALAVIATLERGFDDTTAVLALPLVYRKRLRTTNVQERLNQELRRRERIIRIFPNQASVLLSLGSRAARVG
jgi:putative transposase